MHKFYHSLERLVLLCGRCSRGLGAIAAVLSLLLLCVSVLIVVLRYVLGTGSVSLQESAIYLHAGLFAFGVAETMRRDGHVRVDIFYRDFQAQTRAWVNAIAGLVLLLPFAATLTLYGWSFAEQSWNIAEKSTESEGLPLVYLLKSLIPLIGVSLFLQGAAMVVENTLRLVGHYEFED